MTLEQLAALVESLTARVDALEGRDTKRPPPPSRPDLLQPTFGALTALGLPAAEATALIEKHGAQRVASVLQWVAKKERTEGVRRPLALILSCLANP